MKLKKIWLILMTLAVLFGGNECLKKIPVSSVDFVTGQKRQCTFENRHQGICCLYKTRELCCLPDKTFCCPASAPLIDHFGHCHKCDTPLSVQIGKKSNPGICPNRQIINNKYSILPCEERAPLYDYQGVCHSCDETEAIYMKDMNKALCVGLCPNREMAGHECILPCPKDKPLMNVLGQCFDCETIYPIGVFTSSMCDKCSKRSYIDNMCVLN